MRKMIASQIDCAIITKIVDEDIAGFRKKQIKLEEDCKRVQQKVTNLIEERNKLETDKVVALKNAIVHRNQYLSLSNTFNKELQEDRDQQKLRYDLCRWCKT